MPPTRVCLAWVGIAIAMTFPVMAGHYQYHTPYSPHIRGTGEMRRAAESLADISSQRKGPRLACSAYGVPRQPGKRSWLIRDSLSDPHIPRCRPKDVKTWWRVELSYGVMVAGIIGGQDGGGWRVARSRHLEDMDVDGEDDLSAAGHSCRSQIALSPGSIPRSPGKVPATSKCAIPAFPRFRPPSPQQIMLPKATDTTKRLESRWCCAMLCYAVLCCARL